MKHNSGADKNGHAQEQPPVHRNTVAVSVVEFVLTRFGDNPTVLEGLWLAMQGLGSAGDAAKVIDYCSPRRV